jgi:hypothetical protein
LCLLWQLWLLCLVWLLCVLCLLLLLLLLLLQGSVLRMGWCAFVLLAAPVLVGLGHAGGGLCVCVCVHV